MRFRMASPGGGRPALRLPLSPVRAEMALKALDEWHAPEVEGREHRWFEIKQSGDDVPTQVNIFDEISWWGISAQQFVDELAAIEGDVEVHINSPGGDAFDGITIYNALAARPGVTTVVDGLAASAASVIFMAGKTRVTSPGSMVMIHDALALCIGNAADMRDTAALLDKVSDNIASVYAAHTGTPAHEWRAAMVAEGWYTAAEAVDAGLAHKLAERQGAGGEPGAQPEPEAAFDRSVFTGWQGRARSSDGAGHGHDGDCWDPDGDGDCDLTPEGDTDHDYWSEDGEQLQPVPGKPMPEDRAPRVSNADVDESAWDGPAAMSWASSQDDPEAAFRSICAGEKTVGEPDTQNHWALPHHKHSGDAPNRHGVSAALGRLDATDDLKSKSAAQAHLDEHQKAMGGGDGAGDRAQTDLSGIDLEAIAAGLKGAFA